MVRKHPPQSEAMVKRHLDQKLANLNSTKPKLPPTPAATAMSAEEEKDLRPQPDQTQAIKSNFLYVDCQPVTGQTYWQQVRYIPIQQVVSSRHYEQATNTCSSCTTMTATSSMSNP
jgi:hypothetical protein